VYVGHSLNIPTPPIQYQQYAPPQQMQYQQPQFSQPQSYAYQQPPMQQPPQQPMQQVRSPSFKSL